MHQGLDNHQQWEVLLGTESHLAQVFDHFHIPILILWLGKLCLVTDSQHECIQEVLRELMDEFHTTVSFWSHKLLKAFISHLLS